MRIRSNIRPVLTIALAAVVVVALAAASIAAPPEGKGKKGKPKPGPAPTATATEEPPPPPPTANEADAEFVRMMIPHHHQALIMSRLAPGATSNQEVLGLAGRIDVEQTVEIGTMQAWQNSQGLAVTEPEVAYAMMMQDPAMIEMMGMATQAELDQLASSTGVDFDRLFLRLMIDHHQGAIDMIVDLTVHGTDPVLAQLALDMLNTQQVQIDIMEHMLAGLG